MPMVGWMLMGMPSDIPPHEFKRTPSAKSVREAISTLIFKYKDPRVLQKVLDIRKCQAANGPDCLSEIHKLLLPIQKTVLKRLGLPTDMSGVAQLQNAIQRRICEGDIELKYLANELLQTLSFSGMPTLGQEYTAEDTYNWLNEQDGPERDVDIQEILAFVEDDDERDWQIAELREIMRPRGDISIGVLTVWSHWEAYGLPRHLRVRPEQETSIMWLQNPSVEELFVHVMENRPVVITNALDLERFPPLRNFTDFDYLEQRCGNRVVSVKADSCKDREGRSIFCADPSVQMQFSEYLKILEEAERSGRQPDFYLGKCKMMKELPELVEDIEQSECSPLAKYGACFGINADKTFLYFGGGCNTSCTHFDPSENLLVVLSGQKTYELYPPHDVDCLYPTKAPSYANLAIQPFVSSNASASESNKWPLHEHVRPLYVTLTAGDIMYLPIFWWHGVMGSVERNLQVNWWFDMHPYKREPFDSSTGALGVLNSMREAFHMV